jgi:hypothetical protein
MTDKELLELAAKAAGIEIEWYAPNVEVWDFAQVPNWNPLINDGDALRLAVKLKMYICVGTHTVTVEIFSEAEEPSIFQKVFIEVDEYAATRRAVVRAAAEIGKNAN